MDNNMTPLELSDTFKFSCSEKVPCFNECCQDLNQFLTPYDILRLKNRLGLTSGLFLERFTSQHTGPESGLPIITFENTFYLDLLRRVPKKTSEILKDYPTGGSGPGRKANKHTPGGKLFRMGSELL